MPWLSKTGSFRIYYRARGRQAGLAVTARLWTPTAYPKKGELQALTEVGEGLYYLDFDFGSPGAWPAVFYEAGEPATFAVWQVIGGGSFPRVHLKRTSAEAVMAKRAAMAVIKRTAVAVAMPKRTVEAELPGG